MATFLTGPAQSPPAPTLKESVTVLGEAKKSGKAAESKPVTTMGADMGKALVQGGQTADKMDVKIVQPTSAFDGDGLPGGGDAPGGSNVEATPDGFPRGAPSRAPVVGVTHKPRNMSRVQNRK